MQGLAGQQIDELYMLECLRLARKGAGRVSPNPMVGAVLVHGGKVVGQGYHRRFGGPHAEVEAIRTARRSVRGSTLYVNLEPCSYFGKTPPCTDLLIRSGIRRVVVGRKDPNPRVSGRGIRQLRQAGIDVSVGVLEEECRRLNECFEKFITTGRPFITVKIAQTLDGRIAGGSSRWITAAGSRVIVHALRAEYDAVLVGARTAVLDDPELTVRMVRGRNPLRIILDGSLSVPAGARVFRTTRDRRTLLITSARASKANPRKIRGLLERGVEVLEVHSTRKGMVSLAAAVQVLGAMGIASVLVEGGATVFTGFLQERLADKLIVFVAPKLYGRGTHALKALAADLPLGPLRSRSVDGDVMLETYLQQTKS
jgi:diaminohydroxyphosphoribosylaminopyrimidine deaminase/5-amino-6-(5-phosphoribosylamino)uracil reductase